MTFVAGPSLPILKCGKTDHACKRKIYCRNGEHAGLPRHTTPVVNEETHSANCGEPQSLASRNFDVINQTVLFPQPMHLVHHRQIQVGKC